MEPLIYYGQNREDLILSAFFSDVTKGFYVDIGAYHPIHDSVTKYFYERGWSGINIEPQPYFFKLLEGQRKRDINLGIGISNKSGQMILRSYKSRGLSTFSKEMKVGYEKNKSKEAAKFLDAPVRVDTLKNVFSAQNIEHIHFMKIDVEGLEYEVLDGNDWAAYRPEIICIEANHIIKDWHTLLKNKDYEEVFFDGLNKYYADKEVREHRVSLFEKSFPALLVASPTLAYGWSRLIKKLTSNLNKTQKKLSEYSELNSRLRQELHEVRKKPKA